MDAFPTREEFLASMLQQTFSLPASLMYYILKNPQSSKVYQKLIQTCKHFFAKNPILVFHCLEVLVDDQYRHCGGKCKLFEYEDESDENVMELGNRSTAKLWIDNQLIIYHEVTTTILSNFVLKIYRCDASKLGFVNQKVSLQHWLSITSKVTGCFLGNSNVICPLLGELPLEEIVDSLPKLKKMNFHYGAKTKGATRDTTKKLVAIPGFQRLEELLVCNANEQFDIAPIYDHYKAKVGSFAFDIRFVENLQLSVQYQVRLKEIVDEILKNNCTRFPSSNVEYSGMDREKWRQMFNTYYESRYM